MIFKTKFLLPIIILVFILGFVGLTCFNMSNFISAYGSFVGGVLGVILTFLTLIHLIKDKEERNQKELKIEERQNLAELRKTYEFLTANIYTLEQQIDAKVIPAEYGGKIDIVTGFKAITALTDLRYDYRNEINFRHALNISMQIVPLLTHLYKIIEHEESLVAIYKVQHKEKFPIFLKLLFQIYEEFATDKEMMTEAQELEQTINEFLTLKKIDEYIG